MITHAKDVTSLDVLMLKAHDTPLFLHGVTVPKSLEKPQSLAAAYVGHTCPGHGIDGLRDQHGLLATPRRVVQLP